MSQPFPNEDSLRDMYDRINTRSANSPNWEPWDMDPCGKAKEEEEPDE